MMVADIVWRLGQTTYLLHRTVGQTKSSTDELL